MSKDENFNQIFSENLEYLLLILNKVVILIKDGATVTIEDKTELENHVSKLST